MKIAIFHELHKGGARRGTNEFAFQLKKRGHIINLYTIDRKNSEEIKYYNNIYTYTFKPKLWKGHNWRAKLYKDSLELLKLAILEKKIAADINKKGYDAVYVAASQYIESPFILHFIKTPTFFYCNDPYYRIIYEPGLFKKENLNIVKIYYEYLNRFIRKFLDKWNINKARYIISISEFSNFLFNKAYGRKGDVVHYGVYTTFFSPSKIRKDIDLLFIGSYDYLDGYPFFQEVLIKMKISPKVRVIAFENEWLSDKELLDIYRRTKILVAPAYNEPFGLVPLEAMSSGAVVVAVNEGGHKETIKNGVTGFLLERNPLIFARKLDELLKNPKLIVNMSVNARNDMVENWSWDKQGEKLEKLLLSKINGL